MKTFQKITVTILGVIMAIGVATAQNYKAPQIDASGKMTNKEGNHVGNITKEGVVEMEGKKMAHIDTEGNIVDAATGKKMGKAEKNGNFTYHFTSTKDAEAFTITAPVQGICEVKNTKGETVMLVHENYKAQAACAYHCMQMKKDGKDMKMKSNHEGHTK